MNTIIENVVPLWKQIQRKSFTSWKPLAAFLELSDTEEISAQPDFPLLLPLRLAQKIQKGRWDDPILRQFLPTREEEKSAPLFVLDPVGDEAAQKAPRLLHKYQSRALLLCSGACGMHCRFCFRRHFKYEENYAQFDEEYKGIESDPSLSEILLSGGDPLALSNAQLKDILGTLEHIPHVKRIRFHTRFPIGIPERIDEDLIQLLRNSSKQIVFVIHCNHAQELDATIFKHLKQLQCLGIPLLTQSVLLKGINDNIDALETLFLQLIDHGVLPYYLHQLDRVQGAVHFEVPETKGRELISELQKRLPGYAVPKYVKEEAGCPNKTPISIAAPARSGNC